MGKYLTGEVIKALRIQKGLTQKELGAGIVNSVQISRIEQGKVMPSKFTLEKLFGRLGYDPSAYSAILMSKEEMLHQSKMDEISNLMKSKRNDKAAKLLEFLESDTNFVTDNYCRQFLLYNQSRLAYRIGEEVEAVMGGLMEAIKITVPAYKEEDVSEYWLSKQEMAIIETMSGMYFRMDQKERAINLLYQVKENFEKRYMDVESKQSRYMPIIYNLTKYLGLADRHEEVLALCDKGIEACKRYSAFRFLPLISFNKACSLFELGDIESCKTLLTDVYFTFRLQERFENVKLMEEYAKDVLGISLQEIIIEEVSRKT
ncbi:MAG: helix-turn-helix domain-containing protein [Defluviitaleaceae bacterium]|nr:helix-turn-helix domain-containing protein [Defluviitaleaceae bacterium]